MKEYQVVLTLKPQAAHVDLEYLRKWLPLLVDAWEFDIECGIEVTQVSEPYDLK